MASCSTACNGFVFFTHLCQVDFRLKGDTTIRKTGSQRSRECCYLCSLLLDPLAWANSSKSPGAWREGRCCWACSPWTSSSGRLLQCNHCWSARIQNSWIWRCIGIRVDIGCVMYKIWKYYSYIIAIYKYILYTAGKINIAWNLKAAGFVESTGFWRKLVFQRSIFRFHVNLPRWSRMCM